MFARKLSCRAGGLEIAGYNMPEWGLVSTELQPPRGRCVRTGPGQRIEVGALAGILKSGLVDWVDIDGHAQRLEYFDDEKESFARLFSSSVAGETLADDDIAIHVRAGDIVDGDTVTVDVAYDAALDTSTLEVTARH